MTPLCKLVGQWSRPKICKHACSLARRSTARWPPIELNTTYAVYLTLECHMDARKNAPASPTLGDIHYGKQTTRRRPFHTPTAKCRGRRRTRRAEKADERPVGVDVNTPTAAVGLHNPVGVEPPTNGPPDGDETAVFLRRYADGNAVGVLLI